MEFSILIRLIVDFCPSEQRPTSVDAYNRGLSAADMVSFVPVLFLMFSEHMILKISNIGWMQMMERATRRRDRLSLLTLLEGSVESKKSLAVFNALFEAGGLKALNAWLADAVRLFLNRDPRKVSHISSFLGK